MSTADRESVTVVVPNYNHAQYLDQSLNSIRLQTRPADRVIIVDDASTDTSLDVIARHCAQNSNWRFVRNDANRGVVFGQNLALAGAETNWVTYLGADDVLHPQYLERMLSLSERFPAAGLICACAERFGPGISSSLRPIVLPREQEGFVSPADFRRLLRLADNFFLGTVSMYATKQLRDLGGFDDNLGSLSDAFVARRLAVRHGFGFVPKVLGYWRLHGANFSTTTSTNAAFMEAKLTRASAILAAEPKGLFPPDYVEAFCRRQRFAGARLVAHANGEPAVLRAAKIAALVNASALERRAMQSALSLGAFGATATLTWLALKMRPMSSLVPLAQLKVRRDIQRRTRASNHEH